MTNMKEYWNQGGEAATYSHVITKEKLPLDEYFRRGEKDVEELVVPFLEKKGIKNLKSLTVLDLGCGTGRMSRALGKMFGHVIGTDVSEAMITVAKRDVPESNVRFIATSGADLAGVDANSVDVCISYATLQHVPSKRIVEANFRELYRVLKKGGVAKIEVRGEPGNAPGKVVAFYAFDRWCIGYALWRGFVPMPFVRMFDPLAGACFHEGEMRRMASGLGFSTVEAYTLGRRHLWLELRK